MTITLTETLIILFIHFISDFVLQTYWQAMNKSKNNEALTEHVFTYSLCWIAPIGIMLYSDHVFIGMGCIVFGFIFAMITYLCHWITDYVTSRINSRLWVKGDVHNFFVGVGFDQLMHYVQLLGLYYLIKNI